jgi:STE24 endopeptidase
MPLAPGAVRDRLEHLCRRLNLRCREILVWKSDGAMINAAVMGVIPPVRYILLSDALLTTMNPKQIEAVFGHEAGHVRHRHILHFLGLAFIGWLVVAILMETAAVLAQRADGTSALSGSVIQGMGVAATAIFWIVGFGWVSRCFERQADLFGARCATPPEADCTLPCSVHLDPGRKIEDGSRICATGAAVFASALDRVAGLNGIPRDEPSWRHSSIGSRLHFLASLAGDPGRARSFERQVRRIQFAIRAACLLGAIATVWYWTSVPEPAILRLGERRVPQAMLHGATR